MGFSYSRQPTGKCFVCGKSTKLPIHQHCGEKLNRKRRKARKTVSDEKSLEYFSKLGES